MVVFTFTPFSTSLISEICWHFDVTWLISQQFTRRDLKPVAFLVLPYKPVLHAFFSFCSFKPLVTTLFKQLFCLSDNAMLQLLEALKGFNKNIATAVLQSEILNLTKHWMWLEKSAYNTARFWYLTTKVLMVMMVKTLMRVKMLK